MSVNSEAEKALTRQPPAPSQPPPTRGRRLPTEGEGEFDRGNLVPSPPQGRGSARQRRGEGLLNEVRVIGVAGLPEIAPGDPLPELIGDALADHGGLADGDVVVVTHKVVSKAEGRLVDLRSVEPSPLAARLAADTGKDPRQVEVVLREAKRIVRMVGGVIIAETAHGFVCANAGVDASNVAPDTVCLLPKDPDASAEAIRRVLTARFFSEAAGDERPVGVVVTDSFGRPWRNGIVNVAIGVAGIAPLADYRGEHDAAGYELRASVLAVADELAAAAELVMHKLAALPVAIIRGYRPPTASPPGTGRDLVMPPERDLFR